MTEGYGNTRKQAERNASIAGLRWLKENKLLEENAASSSGFGVQHNPNEPIMPAAFNGNQPMPILPEAAPLAIEAEQEADGDYEMTDMAELSDEEERKF